MNRSYIILLRTVLTGALLMLVAGCTTGAAVRGKQTVDPPPDGGLVSMDFRMSQSAEEVKTIIVEKGYVRRACTGAIASIDNLLDPAVRQDCIGRTVPLERYDATAGSLCEVDLKFNEYYCLENIIIRHVVPSENRSGLLDLYLKHYPMLVFEGSETGENFNPETNRREKITNINYHFNSGRYSFIHLNILRTHQEGGRHEDAITFNAHDSNFVVQEAYKHPCTAPPHRDLHEDSSEEWEY